VLSSQFFEPAVETMSRGDLEALQQERLLATVEYAYERSELTRAAWDRAGVRPADLSTGADFAELAPFLSKSMVRSRRSAGDPYGGLLCVDPSEVEIVGFTSGTTGDPTPLPRGARAETAKSLARELWGIGSRPGDRLLLTMFPFRLGHRFEPAEHIGAVPIFLAHTAEDVPFLFEMLVEQQPTVFYMLSAPLFAAIEQHASAVGVDVAERLQCLTSIVFGGEQMGTRMRERLAEWGVPFYVASSLGDICSTMECSAQDGCHAWEDIAFVEHLGEDGRPAGDGERGELVVTSLTDTVAPLVRFRSGDMVRLTRRPCACGRTHARIWPLGRVGDEVHVDGHSVLPSDVWPVIEAHSGSPVVLFQLVRNPESRGPLEVRAAFDESPGRSAPKTRRAMEDDLAEALGVPTVVELLPSSELLKQGPPHKIPRVVDA
jgi:phenylacetate-CoA ligase